MTHRVALAFALLLLSASCDPGEAAPLDASDAPLDGRVEDAGEAMDAAAGDAGVVDPCEPEVLRARATGLQHSAEEVALWRERSEAGPYLSREDNDARGLPAGAPASWEAIDAMARAYLADPEAAERDVWPGRNGGSSACGSSFVCGIHTMMTAYAALVRGDRALAEAAKRGVMAQVGRPHAMLAHPDALSECCDDAACLEADPGLPPVGCNSQQQGVFAETLPLTRVLRAYDYTRGFPGLYTDDERAAIHVGLRRVMDWYYRGNEAMTSCVSEATYVEGRLDVSAIPEWCLRPLTCPGRNAVEAYAPSECVPFGDWDPGVPSFECYGRALADGTRADPLLAISGHYNNRLSMRWELVVTAALVLQRDYDDGLAPPGLDEAWVSPLAALEGAKRYVQEWLALSAAPDGAEGELARNGNYCNPAQGVLYGMSNLWLGHLLADGLARRGDVELLAFETCEGTPATRCADGDAPKSLRSMTEHLFRLFAHEEETYWGRHGDDAFRLDAIVDYGVFPVTDESPAPVALVWDAIAAPVNRVWEDEGIRTGYLRTRAGTPAYDFTTAPPYAGHGWSARLYSLAFLGGVTWPAEDGGSLGGFTPWMGPHATTPSLLFMYGDTERAALPVYDCARARLR